MTFWNVAAERLTGYPRAEAMGRSIAMLVPQQWKTAVGAIAERVAGGACVSIDNAEMKRKDGTLRAVALSVSPIIIAGTTLGAAISIRDVADEIRARERREQMRRLESMRQLAGGIAERLSATLTPVRSRLDAMRKRRFFGRGPISNVARDIDEAMTLVRELQSFGGISHQSVQSVPIDRAISSAMDVARLVLGTDISLQCIFGASRAMVYADPTQLRQMILGVLTYASDAVRDGGSITLETTVEDHTFRGKSAAPYVVIRVTDTGWSPESKKLPHFEPDVSAIKAGQGLGLASVYGIVRAMKGEVRIGSGAGGTTITMYLPTDNGPHMRTPPRGHHYLPES